MLALPIIGCLITACTNYLGSRIGYSNFSFADKDILFPLSTALFLFYSLLIYVPEVCFFWRRFTESSFLWKHHQPTLKNKFKLSNRKRSSQSLFCLVCSLSLWLYSWTGFISTRPKASETKSREISITIHDSRQVKAQATKALSRKPLL